MATARSSPGHQAGCGCSACASSLRCGRAPRGRCRASRGTSCWAGPQRPRPPSRSCLPCSNLRHVHGLGALVPGLLVVRHLAVLLQRLETSSVDACVVNEKVAVTLVWGDESVALLVVEPLDRTSGHTSSFPSSRPGRSRSDPLQAALNPGFGPDTAPKRTTTGGAWAGRSAVLEGRLAGALLEERADRVLQVLRGEQRGRDLPDPLVRAAYPMFEVCTHHLLRRGVCSGRT